MKGIAVLLVAFAAVLALSECGRGGDSTGSDAKLPSASHHRTAKLKEKLHQTVKRAHQKKKKAKHKAQSRPKKAAPLVVNIAAQVEYRHFSRIDRFKWMTAFEICGATPEERLAQAFQVQANLYEIGHAYGREYTGSAAIATEEGCMTALQGAQSEREAYLASKGDK